MTTRFDQHITEVLIPQEAIARRVAAMGEEVSAAFENSCPLLVGVLKGSALFMADLVRHMKIPLEMDFMAVASYADQEQRVSSGAARITKDLDNVIEGRDVLLVEGIVDTGMTVGYLLRSLEARQPRSIRLCTLLDKPARRIVQVPIAFRGFEIPDRFVVGYGLDFRRLYRNLPYIGVLSGEATGLNRS
ncbi:MAG TPA: hypoxanthine phosphoribosyltransferase [Syntrophobacteraceae bacterium]|nr:hypoxanthine phosphoribosyltransferase [Syntrophobacteraceae bacterium]